VTPLSTAEVGALLRWLGFPVTAEDRGAPVRGRRGAAGGRGPDFTQETAARLVDEVLPRVPGASGR